MSVRRAATWLAVAVFGVLASVRALSSPWTAVQPTRDNIDLTNGQDFRDATYYPLRELLSGGNPYLPSNMLDNWPVRQEYGLYAPSHLVTTLPFAALDYRTSLMVFSVLSICCLFAIGLVCARTYRIPGGWPAAWFLGGLAVLSQMGKGNLYFGQINCLTGLGAVLALSQARRNPAWAAVGLALAWTKPQFGIPLLVVLLARGAWREGVGGTAIAFVVSLPVVVVLVARDGLVGFIDIVRTNVEYSATIPYTAVDSMTGARVDGAAVFYRLTGWLPPFAEGIVFVIVLGTTFLLVRRGRGRPLGPPELLLAGCATLVSMVHQQQESLVVVPGLVAIAAALLVRERQRPLVLVAAFLALLPSAHVYFVENLVRQTVSPWFDSLWEGLVLAISWVLLVWALLSEDRRSVDRVPSQRADHA